MHIPTRMTPGNGEHSMSRTRQILVGAMAATALTFTGCAGSVLDSPSENPLPTTTPEVTIAQVAGTTTIPPTAPRVYVVVSGDTLSGLAEKFGTTAEAIIDINDLADPNSLSIDDELLIPPPDTTADTSE